MVEASGILRKMSSRIRISMNKTSQAAERTGRESLINKKEKERD